MHRSLVPLAVGLLLVLALPVPGRGDEDAKERAVDAVVVPERATLLTAPATGAVLDIRVAIGEWVDAGQTLLRIDPREAELAARAATLEVEAQACAVKVQARRVAARRETLKPVEGTLETAKALFAMSRVASDELVRARAAVARARADLEIAELELEREQVLAKRREVALDVARLRLEQTEVRAPIAGLVEAVLVRKGEIVRAAESGLLALRDPERILVVFDLPAASGPLPGTRVGVVPGEGEPPVAGRVLRVSPNPGRDPAAATVTVQVRPEGSAGRELRPGRKVKVILPAR